MNSICKVWLLWLLNLLVSKNWKCVLKDFEKPWTWASYSIDVRDWNNWKGECRSKFGNKSIRYECESQKWRRFEFLF